MTKTEAEALIGHTLYLPRFDVVDVYGVAGVRKTSKFKEDYGLVSDDDGNLIPNQVFFEDRKSALEYVKETLENSIRGSEREIAEIRENLARDRGSLDRVRQELMPLPVPAASL
jgi:hypothetical protein